MKIIFLDIDGVLNTTGSMMEGIHLCSEKIMVLRNYCEDNDCGIVISSSWRELYPLPVLTELLYRSGFYCKFRIIGVTPIFEEFKDKLTGVELYKIRGLEVERWLHMNNSDAEYVILDDINDFLPYQQDRLVLINEDIGFVSSDRFKLNKILK